MDEKNNEQVKAQETPLGSVKDTTEQTDPGTKKDGSPRKSKAGRPPRIEPPDGVSTEPKEPAMRPTRRKKPVSQIKDPYSALRDAKTDVEESRQRMNELLDRVEKEHPGSRMRALFDDEKKPLEKPLVPQDLISRPLKTTYVVLADRVGHQHIPDDSSFEAVSRSWAEVTRYLGGASPVWVAVGGALVNTSLLFGPLFMTAVRGPVKKEDSGEKKG